MPELKDSLFVDGGQDVPIPAHLNYGKFMFDRIRRPGDDVAVHNATTGDELTYRQLTQQSVNLSVEFSKLGMGRGDVVVLGIDYRIQYLPTSFAVIFAGATVSPASTNTGKAILKHRLTLVPSSFLICTQNFWDLYSEVLKEYTFKAIITFEDSPISSISIKSLISKNHDVEKFAPAEVIGQTDAAVIYYSSGTTGMPKAIELTHVNCIMHSLPNDFLPYKSCFHFGVWATNYIDFKTFKFLAGGKKIVYTEVGKIDKHLEAIEKQKVEVIFFIPVFVYDLVNSEEEVKKRDLSSVKIIYSRSSPLHAKTISKIKDMFSNNVIVYQGYGMTECGELTSEIRGTKGPKAGSVGRPSRGMTMKIVDVNTGASLPPNQNGEICVRGSGVMKGYVNVDPSTYCDQDGFFKTGDLGYYDEDGYFFIIDRLKEIMIVMGFNVAPIELETILQLHPGVKETGVVGKRDPIIGDLPTAFVVKKPGSEVTEQELLDYVKAEVSTFMQLTGGVRFISELPRNPRGKILRRRLREMLEEEP
ncbi:AMP-binding enzyme domain-containing protein [Phthorimaea operculella]|nr:AMP-binding enzyme domain-containing protein [Phthorimaea operculella]